MEPKVTWELTVIKPCKFILSTENNQGKKEPSHNKYIKEKKKGCTFEESVAISNYKTLSLNINRTKGFHSFMLYAELLTRLKESYKIKKGRTDQQYVIIR